MHSFTPDPELTPSERRDAVAEMFARVMLRLHVRAALAEPTTTTENLPDSNTSCLELSRHALLTVHNG